MRSVREQLGKAMEDSSAFHSKCGKSETAQADMCKATADTLDNEHEMKSHLNKSAAYHSEIAGHHIAKAEKDLQTAENISKALEDEMRKALVPDNVTSVPPSDTANEGFGITAHPRMIPRPGQPDLEKAMGDVPHEFRSLLE
jgi:hypothetical protein